MKVRRSPLATLLVHSAEGASGPLPTQVWQMSVPEVLANGRFHRMRPAVHRRLATAPDAPADLLTALRAARRGQVVRQLQAAHDLSVIASLLAESVRWAVAKGPILSNTVWPHPDMREYSDLDVFVDPADFETALRLLEHGGFRYVDRNWPEIRRAARAELAMVGPSGFPLDLHWDIAVSPSARREFRPDLPGMLMRRGEVSLGSGMDLPTFDPTDSVLHLAHHAAQSGGNRLVWSADILHAARHDGVDWGRLAEQAAKGGMGITVGTMLERVERTFGVELPLPESFRRRASRSVPGQIALMRERRHPFPALIGDNARSGAEFSSARRNSRRSVAAALVQSFEVRLTEARVRRHGPDVNPLDKDVPDAHAKRAYLAMVATAGE